MAYDRIAPTFVIDALQIGVNSSEYGPPPVALSDAFCQYG